MPEQTHLESSLEAALGARADLVDTAAPDLVGGARAGAASRRRRHGILTVGGSVAAVVLTAVALPAVLSRPDQGGSPDNPAGSDDLPALDRQRDVRTGPAGWRQVAFHDVTFAVPARYGYGAVDQWCIGDGRPVVQLPATTQTEVACSPLVGMGVVVTPPGDQAPLPDPSRYADGTSLAQEVHAGWTVTVSASSSSVRDRIAASIRQVRADDWINGCPARLDVPALGEAAVATPGPSDAVSVCHYSVAARGPNLARTSSSPRDPLPVLQSAEELTAAPEDGTCRSGPDETAVAIVGDRGPVAWVHLGGCTGRGIDLGGGDTRALTEEVLRLVDLR